jgi:hypothetical protein
MSLTNRLKALEARNVEMVISSSGASDALREELTSVAERCRDTPLNQLTRSAAPAEIAALALDGRIDDTVARKCVEFSKRPGPVGALFTSILEAADAAYESDQKVRGTQT